MKKDLMKGGGNSLYAGLTKKSPSGTEKMPKGESVNSDPTRGSTAPTPPTLGGRVA